MSGIFPELEPDETTTPLAVITADVCKLEGLTVIKLSKLDTVHVYANILALNVGDNVPADTCNKRKADTIADIIIIIFF